MAAQQPPFLVVGDNLPPIRYERFPAAWGELRCDRREAYGCGKNGKRIVDGLHLFTRHGPEDHPQFFPAISVSASTGVLTLIGSEIDEDVAKIYGRNISDYASVHSVDGGVMVFHISFVAGHQGSAYKSYSLVYDSNAPAGALFLLPLRPLGCLPLCPSSPLKLGQDKFSVLLMVEKVAPDSSRHPVLYLWSPPGALPATCIKGKHILNNESEECAWIEKGKLSGADALKRQADTSIGALTPKLVFSYKGNAVFGDLGQGILSCHCRDLNVGPAPVNFKLKMLPLEYREAYDMDRPPFTLYRSMGCVGDSIWFVNIKSASAYMESSEDNAIVNVLTLDSLSEEEEWKPHKQFNMKTIWDLDPRLPKTAPLYPFFRQQDDGILYMLLLETYSGVDQYAHLLGIDLSSDCGELRLLPPRRLVAPWMERPLVLDPSFLGPRSRGMPV